jgi:hypothetical protein
MIHVLHVPGADPQRDDIVAALREQAPGQVCVHADVERAGCMATWLAALACAAGPTANSDWELILSDDADPLPGWQAELAQALHYSPAPVLGLTHFGGYGRQALNKGAPYAVGSYLLWGGAAAYHRSLLPGLAEWAPRVVELTGYPHDDCLVAAYLHRVRLPVALAGRAIFDQPVERSLLGHHTPGPRRPATTIANRQGPPWSTRPAAVPVSRAGFDAQMVALSELA